MAEIALSAVQTVLAALDFLEVKRIRSFSGYQSQLKDLRKAVNTIKNVLKDAESSKVLTNQQQDYIQQLKDVIYEADDLFDEFVTLLETGKLSDSDSFFNKVSSLFSREGLEIFKKTKKIKSKLNAIAENRKFALNVDFKPISSRAPETCSYIDSKDIIIGRDADKKAILDKILQSKSQNVSFLTIVGVGGLGKTALAQLVYNDEKVKQEFGNSMFWVCVSDQFDVKAILCKILEQVIGKRYYDSPKEVVEKEFRKILEGKKYLIVLDDVWNEDSSEWKDLVRSLNLGQGGSRVLVTTRSEITATIEGDEQLYRLQKLSPDDSWQLFEMVAFDNQQSGNRDKMVKIGEKIVDKCNNIPLAIKVIGSLLYGQDISKWESFKNKGLAEMDSGNNKIMSVLKLSYHNLTSSLKSCFSYCAVFPKDFEIKKVLLIKLWIAQGYIELSNEDENIEDVAEEHFKMLLRRCFFQDVKKNEYDEILSIKIHDLMHDVAQEVGGGEVKVLSSIENTLGDGITRHLNILDEKCFKSSSTWTNLRTLLTADFFTLYPKDIQVGKWKSLRVLELKYLNGEITNISFGKLLHLRYLDLSDGHFKKLPNSITELHNLQTLILNSCYYLKELPHDFSKLVKLCHLSLAGCSELRQLPWDFSKLVKLCHLDLTGCGKLRELPHDFSKLVKLSNLNLYCTEFTSTLLGLDKLKEVGVLTKLAGRIRFKIGGNSRNVEAMKDMSGGYLSEIEGLKELEIELMSVGAEVAEAALEMLAEPHPNVKKLELKWYEGRTIPWWRRTIDNPPTIELSRLVYIAINDYKNLVNLPSFSRLPFLKFLRLYGLSNLEYMEATDATFFPSLETLDICGCEKWKGWFREEGLGGADYGCRGLLPFPRLSEVHIRCCPNLSSFPPCPSAKSISLHMVNKTSQLMKQMMVKEEEEEQGEVTIGNYTSSLVFEMCASVKSAVLHLVNKMSQLMNKVMGTEEEEQGEVTIGNHISASSSCLTSLFISADDELESLSEFEKVFETCASTLRSLTIQKCERLRGFSTALQHLTALEDLKIWFNFQLEFSKEDNEEIMAWKPLYKILRSLTFDLLYIRSLPFQLVFSEEDNEEIMAWKPLHKSLRSLTFDLLYIRSLPKGMQYLTSLQTLKLKYCRKLKGLPGWISSLSSLQSLTIQEDDLCDAMESLPEEIQTLPSLRKLKLKECEKLKGLPEWISSLSSLQFLIIDQCNAIESLPEGIQTLTNLQNLKIKNCRGLNQRCQKPYGQDWPKIQHIPNVRIEYAFSRW